MAETDTRYGACACSPLGKMVAQSLPYAYGGSPVWTTYTYDGSGRTVTSVKPDGSTTRYLYSGNNTTTTDPAGKWKTFASDVFGDLITVTEPDPASTTGGTVATNYTYNGASQLTQVSMPRGSITQTRTFTWSGSDMASATNPENGTVSYTYDGNHHVTQRTDAKGQKTNYTYDAYERLTQTQHVLANGTTDPVQQVNYYYDSNPYYPSFSTNAVGRLAAVTFANEAGSAAAPLGSSGTEQFIYSYGYNVAGRVTAQQLTVSPASGYPVNLNASYSWDNQGRMTGLNYPNSGPQETLSYDAMSNLSTINENLCTSENSSGACITWAQGQLASAAYSNIGQLTGFGVLTNGFSSGTSYTYNTLQQLTAINYATNIAGVMVQWTYTYAAGQNNGRITQFSDTGFAGTGEVVNYTYDSLNRLVAATTSNSTGPQWGESYAYDEFGNLQSKTPTQGTAPQVSTGVNSANNQVAPSDANGNWLGSNYPQYAWDVENRLVSNGSYDNYSNAVTYTYDPWGKRVLQYASSGGTKGVTTCQIYFYGANGKRLGIYNCGYTSNGYQFVESTATINQYLGKRLIATGPETGPNVVAVDRLGSVRNVGPAWYFPIDYFPYGEERTSTANGTDKFGTYFRDGYGQDYADQRYYTSNFGRFWSPDPGGIATANPRNPGSWNRYAYTNGDPANYYDPAGTDDINAGCAAFDEAFCEGSTLESNDPMNTGVMAPPGLVNVQCSAMYGLGWEFGGGVAVAACTTSWEQYDELVDGPPNCESNFTDSELDFVAVNYDAAVSLGGQAGVPQDWILAWSANESNWGTSTLATKQGNYFGWHGGGNIQCPPGSNPIEGCFSSYYQSGYTALFSLQQFFRYGGLVGVPAGWILANQYNSGASAAQAFQALASAGYNRNSSYGATIAGQTWLGTVDAAENCLSSLGFLK